jgi:muconolactone delta-isomerase
MKFLVITNDMEVSKSQQAGPVMIESMERWTAENIKKGIIESIYSLAGNHGVVLIIEVKDPEELDAVLIGMPSCAFTQYQIQALADYNKAVTNLKTHYKKALKSLKSRK